MATTKIILPDYQFSGFYYAEILRRLRIFNRVNAPEITSEVAEEPFIQLERSFALVGHLNNVLLDLAANEVLLPTLKLQDSARLLLKLIDFQLRDFSPATTELLCELAQVPTSSVRIFDSETLFETEATEESPAVPFERSTLLDAGPANALDGVFALEKDRGGTDGNTVVGDSDAFESSSMNVTAADLNKLLTITGSILGNNGVFKIAEILQTGATSRIRLAGVLGNDAPLFIFETGLTWKISAFTPNRNAEVNTAGPPHLTPWADVEPGDQLYLGSRHVLYDEFSLSFDTFAQNVTGVWEYYDPDLSDETPDLVTNLGTQLELDLTPLLGTADRRGALVKVTYLPTGTSELIESQFLGGKNVVRTSGFLGQSGTPSTDKENYSIGTDWNPLEDQSDGTTDLTADGKVEYNFPQTLRRNWQRVNVEGVEGFYVRYRVVSTAGPVEPVIDRVRIDEGAQFVLIDVTQGETVDSEPLVSSNGQANQSFKLSQTPGLRDTVRVFIDEGGGEVEYVNRTKTNDSLLTSGPKDRHFVVEQNSLGELTVRFGDGTRGKIPPLGTDNIRFAYRVSASEDGNVGADTITVNADGAATIKSLTNPRPASGWREADGASDASLALVKEQGPASLRTGNRAVSSPDFEDLALDFETSGGTRPIVRAKAIEEGFGPKTTKLVVVGTSGVAISASVKDELEDFFNGDLVEGIEGVGLSNHEATVINFSPKLIGLTLVIEANSALSQELVKTRLSTLVSPTATETDGTTFVWRFGGRVPLSRIAAEVFSISPGNVFDVDIPVPAQDIELSEEELPLLDTANLNISIVAPTVQ